MIKLFKPAGLVETVHYILGLFKDETKLPDEGIGQPDEDYPWQPKRNVRNKGLKEPPKKQVKLPRKRFDRNR